MYGRVIPAGEVAFRPLDLDDLCAKIDEMAGTEWTGDRLLKREHANAG
jgi:hypothetical protein